MTPTPSGDGPPAPISPVITVNPPYSSSSRHCGPTHISIEHSQLQQRPLAHMKFIPLPTRSKKNHTTPTPPGDEPPTPIPQMSPDDPNFPWISLDCGPTHIPIEHNYIRRCPLVQMILTTLPNRSQKII